MEFTGERYLPNQSSIDELSVEHLHRYNSILPFVKNKIVLDIACGEGYGAALMAEQAEKVIGIDISEECILHAADKYRGIALEHLSFIQGNISAIPLQNNSVDVIVSFETIEHVDADTQRIFMAEAKRVLKANGVFIVSTPNITNYSLRYQHSNEFHVHELSRTEFLDLLRGYFANVSLLEQGFEIVSALLPENYTTLDKIKLIRWDSPGRVRKGKYFLGIASAEEIDTSVVASIVADTDKEYLQQIDRILELQDLVEERSAWALKLNKELDERSNWAVSLSKELEEHKDTLKGLNFQLEEKNNELLRPVLLKIDELQQSISNLDNSREMEKGYQVKILTEKLAENERLVSSLKLDIEKLKAGEKNSEEEFELLKNQHEELRAVDSSKTALLLRNSGLQEKNTSLQDNIAQLNLEMKQKDQLLQDLNFNFTLTKQRLTEVNNELLTIYGSDGWKALKKYYNFKGKFLGENSVQYKGLKKIHGLFSNRKSEVNHRMKSNEAAVENTVDQEPIVRTLPHFELPLVSIVIPAYNAWSHTEKCIASIFEHTKDVNYEVILADDTSSDWTKDAGKYFKNIVHVRNQGNLGFLFNCNNAAEFAKGKYIHFLNNDTEVTDGWLSSLIRLMDKDDQIGMVGSKLIYPDGRLQEAGGIIWKDASGWNYGHKQDPNLPEFNYVKQVDYISGASIMIRKTVWDALGGFDKRYAPAYFEDTDIAFEIRKLGLKTMYQPLSVVIHYEGISHGTDTSSGIKKFQLINAEKFTAKWKEVLEKEHFPNGENVFQARDRTRFKKTIIVIDHYVPHFDKDAGSRTIFQLLELFVEMGYNVKFLGDNFYKHEPYTTILEQLGIEVLYGPWYAENWKSWIESNRDNIQFIFINRPHISIKYIDFLLSKTKSKIVYYGHDLHFVREQRQYDIEKSEALLESIKKWEAVETKLIQHSNTVLTLSCDEKEIMEKQLSAKDVRIMPAFSYAEFKMPIADFNIRKDILFVGGFNHKPNVDAVHWFVREVWPIVTATLKDAKFIIVGSLVPKDIVDLESPTISVRGYLSDMELNSVYNSVKMVVVPLRYGGGVKGKTVEAMYQGLPIVSTSFGIEGLEKIREIMEAFDGAEDFANNIIKLYNDNKALANLSKSELNYARNYFSKDHVREVIRSVFLNLTGTPMSKKILITGSCGMMGSHMIDFYSSLGQKVYGTYYKPTTDLNEYAHHAILEECDVRYFNHVHRIISKVKPDVIFHLAAQSYPTVSMERPQETIDTNVNGTINVFESIIEIRKELPSYDPVVVVACSSAEYGSSLTPENVPIKEDVVLLPVHPYGVTKVAQDLLSYQYFINYKIKAIRARIFNTTGPRKVNDVASDFTRRAVLIEKGKEKVFKVGNMQAKRGHYGCP